MMASGKYKYKLVKGSLVVVLRGNIIDFQLHEYGLRNDTALWPSHQEALQWYPWEWCLGDMAYDLCPNVLTQIAWTHALTHSEMVYNVVVGFYRSRVEACVADVVRHKGLFSHPWSGNMPFLKALMTIEVHITQLYRETYFGSRYNQAGGPYAHERFFF